MLTVLVTNTKGGCGKTTIATGIAAAFANSGFRTALADCDRQRSSLGWLDRRSGQAPPIAALDWSKNYSAPPNEVDRLVIDAPAALRRKETGELALRADLIVAPVLPSIYDEAETRRFLARLDKLKPVRKGKRAIAVVGNRMRARTQSAARLEAFLDGIGHRAVARLRDTQLYATTAVSGLSLFDLRTQRAEQFADDWRPLLTFLDLAGANLAA